MEVVVEIRRFVKGEIRIDGLTVDQRRDVIVHQVRLHRADPLDRAAQHLGKQKHDGHQSGRPEYRAPAAARADGGNDSIDDRAREIDGGDREKSLNEQKDDPGKAPVGSGAPDEAEGPRQVRQRAGGAAKISGNRTRPRLFWDVDHSKKIGKRRSVSVWPKIQGGSEAELEPLRH